MMDEPTATTTTDGGEAPTLSQHETSLPLPSEEVMAVSVEVEEPTISVSEIPLVPAAQDETDVNVSTQLPAVEETVDTAAVAAAVASSVQMPEMPPVPNPQDLLVIAAAQHSAAVTANDAADAVAAAASSILAPSEISAEVTAAAAAAAASLNGFSGGDSDIMLSNEIAQTVLDAATPHGSQDPSQSDKPNFSHEQHLASRRMKDRERYASMTPDQREIYNSKRREQYHRQSENSRKKRRERERTRYHSLTLSDAKERNIRRAALERERYKKLDPAELAARNARRRERAAALRAQKKAAAAAAAAAAVNPNGKVDMDITMQTQVVAPMVPQAAEVQAPVGDAAQTVLMEQVMVEGTEMKTDPGVVQDETHISLAPLPNLPVAMPMKEEEASGAASQDKSLVMEV